MIQEFTSLVSDLGVPMAILCVIGTGFWIVLKRLLTWFQDSVVGKITYQTGMIIKLIDRIRSLEVTMTRLVTLVQTIYGIKGLPIHRRQEDSDEHKDI